MLPLTKFQVLSDCTSFPLMSFFSAPISNSGHHTVFSVCFSKSNIDLIANQKHCLKIGHRSQPLFGSPPSPVWPLASSLPSWSRPGRAQQVLPASIARHSCPPMWAKNISTRSALFLNKRNRGRVATLAKTTPLTKSVLSWFLKGIPCGSKVLK